jgi:glycosyltransferase involved in cell wall biosynthesis
MISVIVPVYNCAGFLYECLSSLEAQTRPPAHLIIVDDGSTDNSALVAENFARNSDLNITVRSLGKNLGVAHAKNIGLSYVTTPYFTFLGADDFCSPRLLEVYESFFALDSSLGLVGVGCAVVDIHGVEVGRLKGYPEGFDSNTAMYYQVKRNHLWSGTTCFRRLKSMSGFDTELYNAVDFDFCFQYLLKGLRIQVTNEPLACYRSHPQNISKNYSKAKLAIKSALQKIPAQSLIKSLQRNFNKSQVQLSVGFLMFHREDYVETIRLLTSIDSELLSVPEIFESVFLISSSYYALKEYDHAFLYACKLLSSYPEEPTIRNNLGVLGLLTGRLSIDEALASFRCALRIRDNYVDASQNLDCATAHRNSLSLRFTDLPLRENSIHS